MRQIVSRAGLFALALVMQAHPGAAQDGVRSFAAPQLLPRPPGTPEGPEGHPPAALPMAPIAPLLPPAPPMGMMDPAAPAAGETRVATAVPAPGAPVTAKTPTPQWPLTAQDLADRKRQQASGTPAPPQSWPASEVVIAKARCAQLLKNVEAVYIPQEPIREGECGAMAPVQLMAIGKNPQVVISPPAIVTCDLVSALHEWLQKDLQPSARKWLGSPIVKIENMSSYSCRNAYGRARTRMSEHGRANALDIRGFLTASGQGTELLADWGPTARDVRAAEVAAAQAAAARAAAQARSDAAKGEEPAAPSETGSIPGGIGTLVEGLPRLRVLTPQGRAPEEGGSGIGYVAPSRLGGPKPAGTSAAGGRVLTPPAPTGGVDRKQQFLREAHVSACRTFKTVLGPEANNAHRNHFHIDMAERASGAFCE